jgi:hypothetical protein
MNLTVFSYILLAIFAISIVIVYLGVRRGQIAPIQAGIYGCIVDVIVIGLFSLSVETGFVRAAVNGALLGIVFNMLAVLVATYFRRNARTSAASAQPE